MVKTCYSLIYFRKDFDEFTTRRVNAFCDRKQTFIKKLQEKMFKTQTFIVVVYDDAFIAYVVCFIVNGNIPLWSVCMPQNC